MKKIVLDFLRRGLIAMGIGPIVLVILYLAFQNNFGIQMLTVNQVCVGIVSLSALAFIAGGINVIYQIERLPLMAAISIHGMILYLGYLGTYLINGWLEQGIIPIIAFSGIFAVGYLAIWGIVYSIVKRNTEKVNKILKQKQEDTDN